LIRQLKSFCNNKYVGIKYDINKLNRKRPDYLYIKNVINKLYKKVTKKLSELGVFEEKDITLHLYEIEDLLYDESDIAKTVSMIEVVGYDEIIDLTKKISFKLGNA
jgi:glycerol dehydrogenase-like iron-containing ADH family enzyme